MPSTRLARSSRTTKSSPCSLNASIGAGAPLPVIRWITPRMLLPVMSGFCSDPERLNSRRIVCWSSRNHVCGQPLRVMCSSVPRLSKPGYSGGGSRLPVGSSQSDDGPGRMRMPWRAHTGFQLRRPSQ